MLVNAFMYFYVIFVVVVAVVVIFYHKVFVFIIFISFSDKVSNFRNRILTNQKRELVVSNCENNLEQFNFFTSTELVSDGLITADEMLQSIDIELSEVSVPLLKFVNEDDIGMVGILDSISTASDIYLSSL